MQAMTLASAVVLAPALALFLGLVVVGLVGACRLPGRPARWIGLPATACALGMAVRLWLLARSGALLFDVVQPPTTVGLAIGGRLDVVAGVSLVAALAVGLTSIDRGTTEPRAAEVAALLGSLLLAVGLLLVDNIAIVAELWAALVLVAAGGSIAARHVDVALSWMSLACCGVPALVLSGATLTASSGGGASLVGAPGVSSGWAVFSLAAVGALSAGITPLNAWLDRSADSGVVTLIADALLPLAGFYLAARAVGLVGAGGSTGLTVLLMVAGFWGIADAAHAAWTAGDHSAVSRAAGRGECGLAFVALAIGTQPAIAAALFLTVFGVLARTLARTAGPDLLGRVGWASMAGLPPLPGFAARWLIVVAAFAVGDWLLGLAVGVAALVLDLGLFGSISIGRPGDARSAASDEVEPTAAQGVGQELVSRRDAATIDRGTAAASKLPSDVRLSARGLKFFARRATAWPRVAIAGVLVLAGLAPARWLLATLLPVAAMPGRTAPTALLPATLLAVLVAVLPILVAGIAVRPWLSPPRQEISRTIQERAWDVVERSAERTAELSRVVEGRYNLAFGFLVVVAAAFALVR